LKSVDEFWNVGRTKVFAFYICTIVAFLQRQLQEIAQLIAHPRTKSNDSLDTRWIYTWRTLKQAIAHRKDVVEWRKRAFDMVCSSSVNTSERMLECICGVLESFARTWGHNATIVADSIPTQDIVDDSKDVGGKLGSAVNDGACEFDASIRQQWEEMKQTNLKRLCVLDGDSIEWGRKVSDGVRQAKYGGQKVTVHKIAPDSEALSAEGFVKFLAQLAVLNFQRFPYAAPFHGVSTSGYLTVERGDTDLMDWYRLSNDLSWARKLRVLCGAARALRMLHALPTVHKSVDSRSFYVSEHQPEVVRIADVSSLSEFAGVETVAFGRVTCFSPSLWVAPELFEGEPHSFASDVFGFGVVMYEVAAQRHPYGIGSTDAQVWEKKQNGVAPCIVPEDCPKKLAGLMRQCCMLEPGVRPSMDEVVRRLQEALIAV